MLRPPLVSDPVAELKIRGTLSAAGSSVVQCTNTFYYRRTVGATVSLPGLVTSFQAGVVAALAAATVSRYAVNMIDARLVTDPTAIGVSVVDATVGAIATDGQPSLNAVVIDMLTATRGRAGRGRKFFGGVSEAATTGDVIVASLALWQAVRDALDDSYADGAGNTWKPFVLSKWYSTLNTSPTVVYGDNVLSCVLNKRVSRLDKRKSVRVV